MAHLEPVNDWNLTPTTAVALQRELSDRVAAVPLAAPICTIAGADISYNKYSSTLYTAVVVLELPSLTVVESSSTVAEAQFPYVPGLLAFREAPPILEAWARLRCEPDALMVDGHGLAHPRRFGIACLFLGLWVRRPTLGCAKSVLVGRHEEPPPQRGAWTPLVHRTETVGAALRTRDRVQPVFVSIGDRITLDEAVRLTLACHGGYRIPEPTRQAHLLVNRLRQSGSS